MNQACAAGDQRAAGIEGDAEQRHRGRGERWRQPRRWMPVAGNCWRAWMPIAQRPNSAAATITRLVDMGVEPFLISSTLMAVLAQSIEGRRLREENVRLQ